MSILCVNSARWILLVQSTDPMACISIIQNTTRHVENSPWLDPLVLYRFNARPVSQILNRHRAKGSYRDGHFSIMKMDCWERSHRSWWRYIKKYQITGWDNMRWVLTLIFYEFTSVYTIITLTALIARICDDMKWQLLLDNKANKWKWIQTYTVILYARILCVIVQYSIKWDEDLQPKLTILNRVNLDVTGAQLTLCFSFSKKYLFSIF